jgi:hypothetical protein
MEPTPKSSEEKQDIPSSLYNKRKGSPGTPEYLYETIVLSLYLSSYFIEI